MLIPCPATPLPDTLPPALAPIHPPSIPLMGRLRKSVSAKLATLTSGRMPVPPWALVLVLLLVLLLGLLAAAMWQVPGTPCPANVTASRSRPPGDVEDRRPPQLAHLPWNSMAPMLLPPCAGP